MDCLIDNRIVQTKTVVCCNISILAALQLLYCCDSTIYAALHCKYCCNSTILTDPPGLFCPIPHILCTKFVNKMQPVVFSCHNPLQHKSTRSRLSKADICKYISVCSAFITQVCIVQFTSQVYVTKPHYFLKLKDKS